MADTLRDLAYGAALRGQLPQQPPPFRDTLASLLARQDSIGAPQRGTIAGMVGDAGTAAQRLAQALDAYGMRVPGTQARISLKDLTLGDAGQVVEDMSYGMPPTTGGNYATGGVGTMGAQPRAMDLFNLGGVAGGAAQAGKVGARVLGPTLREMARKGIEGNMRATGGIQDLITYHGSPHTFDRFDSSKIGTGEGAQAYGHGLYLAESPKVAQSYAETLANSKAPTSVLYKADGVPIAEIAAKHGVSVEDANRMIVARNQAGNYIQAEAALKRANLWKPEMANVYAEMFGKKLGWSADQTGSLYKVDLPDSMIERMLDWDKPLSAQGGNLNNGFGAAGPRSYSTTPGEHVYKRLAETMGSKDAAAKFLQQRGIPGIRYLDGGSRADGLGTSNFVIFPGEESALTILERNGRPLR
jgi:hypothetical protein